MWKAIGGLLGLFVLGPIGALIGFVAGLLADNKGLGGGSLDRQAVKEQYFKTTFTLMGHLAKADGRISEAEIKMAEQQMSRMGIHKTHRQEAIALFKKGAAADFSLSVEMQHFTQVVGRRSNLYKMLLVTLISTAFADNELHSAEREVLREVAGHLSINSQYFDQILQMAAAQQGFGQQRSYRQNNAFKRHASDPVGDAYKALGVASSVSDRDLKRAYRKLISQHHPDKLIAQGMPDDMIDLATEKTQAIQAAYELLQKERGLAR